MSPSKVWGREFEKKRANTDSSNPLSLGLSFPFSVLHSSPLTSLVLLDPRNLVLYFPRVWESLIRFPWEERRRRKRRYRTVVRPTFSLLTLLLLCSIRNNSQSYCMLLCSPYSRHHRPPLRLQNRKNGKNMKETERKPSLELSVELRESNTDRDRKKTSRGARSVHPIIVDIFGPDELHLLRFLYLFYRNIRRQDFISVLLWGVNGHFNDLVTFSWFEYDWLTWEILLLQKPQIEKREKYLKWYSERKPPSSCRVFFDSSYSSEVDNLINSVHLSSISSVKTNNWFVEISLMT